MATMLLSMLAKMDGCSSNNLHKTFTLLGIILCATRMFPLISLGQAVQDYVANQFLGIGTNLAVAIPTSYSGASGGITTSGRASPRFSEITDRDLAALSDP